MTIVAPLEFGLACSDPDLMLGFYARVFGLRMVSDIVVPADIGRLTAFSQHGYRVIRMQAPCGARVKLLSSLQEAGIRMHAGPENNLLHGEHRTFLTFIVAALTPVLQLAVDWGGTPVGDAVTIRDGLLIAFLCDPEGNYIELAQYADLGSYRPDLVRRG